VDLRAGGPFGRSWVDSARGCLGGRFGNGVTLNRLSEIDASVPVLTSLTHADFNLGSVLSMMTNDPDHPSPRNMEILP